MNKKAIIALIAIVLVIFVIVKVSLSYLCAPNSSNAVVAAASGAISEAISSPQAMQNKTQDSLSWEPVMHRLLGFFSKACNN